jgi:hypothetical protein
MLPRAWVASSAELRHGPIARMMRKEAEQETSASRKRIGRMLPVCRSGSGSPRYAAGSGRDRLSLSDTTSCVSVDVVKAWRCQEQVSSVKTQGEGSVAMYLQCLGLAVT